MMEKKRSIIARKGISELVSYVLLAVMAIALASGVYIWARSKIPVFQEECPEGISLIIEECKFESSNNVLNITFSNGGNFNITGLFVYVVFDDNFTMNLTRVPEGEIEEDYLPLSAEKNYSVNILFPDGKNYNNIKNLEFIPFKIIKGKTFLCRKVVYPFEFCKV